MRRHRPRIEPAGVLAADSSEPRIVLDRPRALDVGIREEQRQDQRPSRRAGADRRQPAAERLREGAGCGPALRRSVAGARAARTCAAATASENSPIAVKPGISQIQSTALCPIITAPAAAGAMACRRRLPRAGSPARADRPKCPAEEQQEQPHADRADLAQKGEHQAVGIVEVAVGPSVTVVAERVVVGADPQQGRASNSLSATRHRS